MSDPFIGEIRGWACSYPPSGWAMCNGQQVPVMQSQALFAVIAGLYGPYTQQLFTLPNLQSRSPMDAGTPAPQWTGTGLPSPINVAQSLGNPTATLTTSQMANHTHQASGATAPPTSMTVTPSAAAYVSRPLIAPSTSFPAGVSYNAWTNTGTPNALMASQTLGVTGGGQPHDNHQPFLTFLFCIALIGLYPVRN